MVIQLIFLNSFSHFYFYYVCVFHFISLPLLRTRAKKGINRFFYEEGVSEQEVKTSFTTLLPRATSLH